MGAMNPLYCILLAISVYMEVFLGTGRGGLNLYLLAFNNNNNVPAGGDIINPATMGYIIVVIPPVKVNCAEEGIRNPKYILLWF